MTLLLSEKSYLLDILQPHTDLDSDSLWDLLESVTREQRATLIALEMKKDRTAIKETLEQIQAQQKG